MAERRWHWRAQRCARRARMLLWFDYVLEGAVEESLAPSEQPIRIPDAASWCAARSLLRVPFARVFGAVRQRRRTADVVRLAQASGHTCVCVCAAARVRRSEWRPASVRHTTRRAAVHMEDGARVPDACTHAQ